MSSSASSQNNLEARLESELAAFRSQKRFRSLTLSDGIDFTSNDYLGLATSERLRERVLDYLGTGVPLSSSGSRLLRGNHREHEMLEARFAAFTGYETALFFNSGYDANLALLTALPSRHDLILLDSLVHASIKEGAHASLAAKRTFAHNSMEALHSVAPYSSAGHVFVVVESVYSMDGDESPLKDIAGFCEERGYTLIVDEAHTTGVFGRNGRGFVDELELANAVEIVVHTCGKALAAAGAVVTCSQTVKNYLINRARPLIYSTALPPIIPFQIVAALDVIEGDSDLHERLWQNVAQVRGTLTKTLHRWHILEGRSPIVAVIIGDEAEAIRASEILQARGLDIRAIRPPSVPNGTSRLRVTIHADHTPEQLERLTATLTRAEAECAG